MHEYRPFYLVLRCNILRRRIYIVPRQRSYKMRRVTFPRIFFVYVFCRTAKRQSFIDHECKRVAVPVEFAIVGLRHHIANQLPGAWPHGCIPIVSPGADRHQLTAYLHRGNRCKAPTGIAAKTLCPDLADIKAVFAPIELRQPRGIKPAEPDTDFRL